MALALRDRLCGSCEARQEHDAAISYALRILRHEPGHEKVLCHRDLDRARRHHRNSGNLAGAGDAWAVRRAVGGAVGGEVKLANCRDYERKRVDVGCSQPAAHRKPG